MKKKIIKFILSFTDYDKLKDENKKLNHDISILIDKPDSLEAYVIIQTHKTRKQLYSAFWRGCAGIKVKEFDGFFPRPLH